MEVLATGSTRGREGVGEQEILAADAVSARAQRGPGLRPPRAGPRGVAGRSGPQRVRPGGRYRSRAAGTQGYAGRGGGGNKTGLGS